MAYRLFRKVILQGIFEAMRICHVIEAASGGAGQIVLDLARAGLESGDEVTVVYAPDRAQERFIKVLRSLQGVNIMALSMRRNIGLRDISSLWSLWLCLMRAGPFDVIHGHSSKAGALVRIAGLFLRHPVVIYSPHAFITMAPDASPLYTLIERLLSLLCDAIITVSPQEERHALEQLGIARGKVRMIMNGVDMDRPSDREVARNRMGFSENDFVVGFVGRLEEQKNPRRLVETFALVSARLPQARLAVIGSGHLREMMESLLERKGLSGKTWVFPDVDARDYISGFDCLLCTSDYESFALIFPEAMAVGVPVVTPPVGIAEAAVVDGVTGYIAGFEPKSLADAVLKIAVLDSKARAQMHEEARRRARMFDMKNMAENTRALYKELLQRKKARA